VISIFLFLRYKKPKESKAFTVLLISLDLVVSSFTPFVKEQPEVFRGLSLYGQYLIFSKLFDFSKLQ
jgi:hypothetical protein